MSVLPAPGAAGRPPFARLRTPHAAAVAAALLVALVYGAALGARPGLATAAMGALVVLALAFLAPATHLTILLVLAAVVPFSYQNAITGPAGLLPSDVFLLTGMLRGALLLVEVPLDRRARLVILALLAFLAGALAQFLHGLGLGRDLSVAGAEFRQLLSYGVLLIVLPMLADPLARSRVLRALLITGLLLGLWGVAQWALNLSFSEAGDVGVRSGVRLTTSGIGQVQGGLYGFPVAVAVAFAALMSGTITTARTRVLVLAALGLNALALLLTFERTFWVAAIAAIGMVILRLGGATRMRALIATPLLAVVAVAVLSVAAPALLATAQQRLLSLGQYGSDNSIRYRVIESQHVLVKIAARPLAGWGLGDTVWWGRPYANVPATSHKFSHNGYLWLAWKIGIPLTLLLTLLIGAAIFWRGPPASAGLPAAVRLGGQAGLLALFVINITWPSFRMPSITPVMGVLLALAASRLPSGAGQQRQAASASSSST